MIIKAYAKINLFLNITGIDPVDGYHYLDSVFQTVSLYDEISIKENKKNDDYITFDDESLNNNSTVHKAMKYLRESFDLKDYYDIHIKKNIPTGAGLGGGSSDAGAILKYFFKKNNYPFEKVLEIAKKIGSDVSFFLYGGLCRVMGKGELIKKYNKKIENIYFLLVYPDINISTKEAYRLLDEIDYYDIKTEEIGAILNDLESYNGEINLDFLKKICYNSFSKLMRGDFVRINEIKESLSSLLDANYSFMSGSGSTLVFVYNSKSQAENDFLIVKRERYKKAFLTEAIYKA